MKRIMIVGAGFLQKYVIQKAKALGYYVITVDGFPKAPGFKYANISAVIDITDIESCLAFAKAQRIDGVMTAATDYGVLTAAHISTELGLPGIGIQTAETVKNKFSVHRLLSENMVDDSAPAYEIYAPEDARLLAYQVKYPVMVKPCDGSGSRGAARVDVSSKLYPACTVACSSSKTGRALIEPFVDGIEYGVESFVYNGVPHVLAIMKKWMTPPPYYAELGHAIPCGLPISLEDRIKRITERAIRKLGIDIGAVNMDILVTKDSAIHIIDVGARMGGNMIGSHIIPIGTGYDYMANLIRAAVGDEVELPSTEGGKPVATKLMALTPGFVNQLPDFTFIQERYAVTFEHHLAVGDTITPYRTNLDGCGYIIATGESVNDAEGRVAKALSEIDTQIVRS